MKIPRGRGVSNAQFSREKYDAKVEFPEEWGVQPKTLKWGGRGGGMDSSWNNNYC